MLQEDGHVVPYDTMHTILPAAHKHVLALLNTTHLPNQRLQTMLTIAGSAAHMASYCTPFHSFALNHSTADAAEKGSSYDTVPSPLRPPVALSRYNHIFLPLVFLSVLMTPVAKAVSPLVLYKHRPVLSLLRPRAVPLIRVRTYESAARCLHMEQPRLSHTYAAKVLFNVPFSDACRQP